MIGEPPLSRLLGITMLKEPSVYDKKYGGKAISGTLAARTNASKENGLHPKLFLARY